MPELSAEVREALQAYSFPGNVRELKNIVERALIESKGQEIQVHHLHFAPKVGDGPPALVSNLPVADLPLDLEGAAARAELWVVTRVVAQAGGNVSEAARLLNTNRNRIYRILDQEPPSPQP